MKIKKLIVDDKTKTNTKEYMGLDLLATNFVAGRLVFECKGVSFEFVPAYGLNFKAFLSDFFSLDLERDTTVIHVENWKKVHNG